MGIKGLLQVLKSIQRKKHISEYKGQRVGVDCYCWLHKAIYSCMDEFYLNINSDQYINFFISKIKQFESYGIKLIMVFDGANLPIKNQTEDDREKKRQNSLKKSEEYRKLGLIEKAKKHLVKSIDVTPLMVYKLIKVLKDLNVEYYVAPYEADAQLAYLSRIKYVNLVITEDSDLLVYNCDRVLFHLDSNGWGFEITMKELHLCKELNFASFTEEMFIQTCILSGCDYIESITGIGLKTGHALITKFKDYKEVIRNLIINPKYIVPKGYEEGFEKAFLTFYLQLIYCPIKKRIVHLNDVLKYKKVLEKYKDLSFLGNNLKQDMVEKVISGDVDPNSLIPFNDILSENENYQQIKLDEKQTSINMFFSCKTQTKTKKRNLSKKKEKKDGKNFIVKKNESLSINYLQKKKFREEFCNPDNEEEIINLAFENIKNMNYLDEKHISSDFEVDEVEKRSIKECLAKTNEKTVRLSSSFESESFNFEDYKYKPDNKKEQINYFNQLKTNKNKVYQKNKQTSKKIFGVLKEKNQIKSFEIINLNEDSMNMANYDIKSFYNKE